MENQHRNNRRNVFRSQQKNVRIKKNTKSKANKRPALPLLKRQIQPTRYVLAKGPDGTRGFTSRKKQLNVNAKAFVPQF